MGQGHCFLFSCYLPLIVEHSNGIDSSGGIIPVLHLITASLLQERMSLRWVHDFGSEGGRLVQTMQILLIMFTESN